MLVRGTFVPEPPPPPWLRDWHGDGIIARLPQRAVAAKGLPVVELFSTAEESGLPMVGGDNEQIARLALEHFWERGFRHFAYCGLTPATNRFIALRGEAFRRQAEAAGCACAVFSVPSKHWAVADWEREEEQIAGWLPTLPRPVGVLACYDERGYQVLNACRRAGLRVPEDVAVLGVGNDPVLCEMCIPPLSSIDLDSRLIGYVAASCLDRMMRGGRAPTAGSTAAVPREARMRFTERTVGEGSRQTAAPGGAAKRRAATE